jgi:hypothetical protein
MIEIDVSNFTPFSCLVGGVFIGIAVILYFISTGKLAGVSGIVYNVFNNGVISSKQRFSNLLFLIGLVLGPLFYSIILQSNISFKITSSIPLIVLGGILVGLGTKIGSGCTSGHGICGISRFSIRSIVATVFFMFLAMATVLLLKLLGFN